MSKSAGHRCGIKGRAGEVCLDPGVCYKNPQPEGVPSPARLDFERASWEVYAAALVGFRRLYGIAANPENMPREWTAVVREVRQDMEDSE